MWSNRQGWGRVLPTGSFCISLAGNSASGRRAAMDRQQAVSTGIGFGSALAITISWSLHQSLLWAVIHGFFGWLYVIYYAVTR
jgi:hypothetical protein